MSLASPSLRAIATKGAIFMGTAQAYRVMVGFVSSILLIRLLAPSDFGLVAMVTVCVAFVAMLQNLGINQVTIQREHISHAQMSALFWLSVGLSTGFAAVFATSAPLIAMFFGDSRLIPLTWAFAGLVFLAGFQLQQIAYLNRHLQFRKIAAIEMLSTSANALVGVMIAWITASYWALFFAPLASLLVTILAAWMLSGWRPGRPTFEGDLKDILQFGFGVAGFDLVNYFARNADNVLIGRVYGAEQLGYYDRAYKLLLFPLRQLSYPLGRVMLPLLSRLKNEPERYRSGYTECVTLLMVAVHPGLVFLIVFAEDVFNLLFGLRWLPAAPLFRWLGILGLLQIIMSTSGWLYMSQGRVGDYFRTGVLNATITVLSFLVGISWGPVGVAIAYTLTGYFLRAPIVLRNLGRRGPVSTRDLVVVVIPHALAVAAAAGALMAYAAKMPPLGLLGCLLLAVASYGVYALVILMFPEKRAVFMKSFRHLSVLASPRSL